MIEKYPTLPLWLGGVLFLCPFSGCLVGFRGFSGGVAYGFGDVLNGHC